MQMLRNPLGLSGLFLNTRLKLYGIAVSLVFQQAAAVEAS